MNTIRELVTRYVPGEGRPSMRDCIHMAADWCLTEGLGTLVIFTGTGEGPHYAAQELLVRERYKGLKVVAVTPPVGRQYRKVPGDDSSEMVRAGISSVLRDELTALGVVVVSAHLPFKEVYDGSRGRGSEWARVAESFGILGGGFALCIQAALLACDAGAIEHGDRVVAMSADTAVVVRACRTESFLSPSEGLLAEHIICRPGRYNISKSIHETIKQPEPPSQQVIETTAYEPQPPQLPPVATKKTSRAKKKAAPTRVRGSGAKKRR
jgi:hypothetical protein